MAVTWRLHGGYLAEEHMPRVDAEERKGEEQPRRADDARPERKVRQLVGEALEAIVGAGEDRGREEGEKEGDELGEREGRRE